jgi:TolB-like protein
MARKTGMGRFWGELRRRRVVRAVGMYVAAAFVVLQLGEIVLPAFNMPDWALQSLVVLAVLGLPVVLAIAWVYDLTPGGFQRTGNASPAAGGSAIPRIAFLVVTLVAVGFASVAYARITFGAPATGAPEGVASFVNLDADAPISAIAVLPLDDFAEGDDFFARSLHEEIIAQLGQLTSLRVVSRTSVERYADTDKLLPEIAQELGVHAIVEGSVTKPADSDTVRITIQLIHAPSDSHLMAKTFERELKDILRLQREVAQDIAAAIQGQVDEPTTAGSATIAAVDPEAHEAYLMGRAEFEKDTPAGIEAAHDYFRQAVDLDSSYSAAHAGLAGTEVLLGLHGLAPIEEALMAAQVRVAKAVALDEDNEEARAVMIVIQDHMEGMPEDVRAEMEETVEFAYSFSDSLSRTYLENFTRLGARARAVMEARQPEPATTARSRMFQAQRLIADTDFDGAAALLGQVVSDDPETEPAWYALERTRVLQGRYDLAVEVRKDRMAAVHGDTPETRARIDDLTERFDPADPSTYWQWLRKDHGERQDSGDYASSVEYAAACVALGDYEDAIDNLEQALEDRDPALLSLRFDPTWDPIRTDPRFRDITRQIRAALRPSQPPPVNPRRR